MIKRWMIASCVMVGIVVLNIAPGYAQEPSIVGNWNITFFLEPNHNLGVTQCIVFTLNPGSVVGEPLEGQWSSTTFPNWSGDWFQEGEHVQFYGSTGGGLATQEYGDLASNDHSQGKFQHYRPLNPGSTTSSAGAWAGSRVQACPAPVPGPSPATSADPSGPSAKASLVGSADAESTMASLPHGTESALPEIVADLLAKFEAY